MVRGFDIALHLQNELRLQDMSWKQNDQLVITNKSNSEISLYEQQDRLQATKRTNVEIKLETTYSNSKNKDNLSEIVIQNKYKKNSCSIINEGMNKNVNFVNEKESSLNHKSDKNKKSKIDENVTKNINDSKCNLENNTLQETKHDDLKLTDQLLQIDIPEFCDTLVEELSTNFFESSSPKITSASRQNSESLLDFDDRKKDCIRNVTIKHSINEVQNIQNVNDIPTKKIRISDETGTKVSACRNTITHLSSFQNDIKTEVLSRSPSLFDDSLNLDTQICNVLEQNIVDSLQFTEFEETRSSEPKVTIQDKKDVKLQITSSTNNNETVTEKIVKDKHINKNSLNPQLILNSQVKQSILSWKDDSWNETKKIMEKLNQIKDKNNHNIPIKYSIKDGKNANVQHFVETNEISSSTLEIKRKCDMKFERAMDDYIKKGPQKCRLSNVQVAKSPIANVMVFSKNGGTLLDSNKSDSDEIIIASQNINSPATSSKLQSKLDSVRKQKLYTQKVSDRIFDDKNHATTVSDRIEIEKCKIKSKLNEILVQKALTNKNSSIDSVILNSDEDTPIKSENFLQKSTFNLKSTQNSPKTCVKTNELADTVNETTNWNTLNIIKVGSDRATFNLFKREVMQKRYIALALNCELYNDKTNNIGSKIIGPTTIERKKRSKKAENYVYAERKLCGAAIAWENNIAYYISFSNERGT